MKSFKSALTLVAAATALFAAAASVHAASDSANLELRGSVAINCTIGVVPTAKATSLDIVAGEQDAVVANVTENCNAGNGYVVSLTSKNAGKLMSTANGAKPMSYQASYDNAGGSIAAKLDAVRDVAQFGRTAPLKISLTGDTQAIAGDYNDNISLVIAAK